MAGGTAVEPLVTGRGGPLQWHLGPISATIRDSAEAWCLGP